MKKVLIISYYWPPAGGPGSQRAVKFAKYLPDFGWEPVILTVRKGEYTYLDPSLESDISAKMIVRRTPSIEPFLFYKKIAGLKSGESIPIAQLMQKKTGFKNRIFNWIRANLFVPDARIGWIPFARKTAKQLVRDHQINMIFSTSPPHSSQLIGKYLHRKFKIPWVADFRDPWTDIQYYKIASRNFFARKLDKHYERTVIESANHITAVSRGLIQGFRDKINNNGSGKFTVLPNGYDPTDFQEQPVDQNKIFWILHTGNMNVTQNPAGLWEALSHWLVENPGYRSRVRVKFIGRIHPEIVNIIREYELEDVTEIESYKPHEQIIRDIEQSALLLSVVPDVLDNLGIVLSKNFEYIGSSRPILIFGPPESDIGKIIAKFSNSLICPYQNVEKCKKFIEEVFTDWQSNRLQFLPAEQREIYSRRVIAGKLADIFDGCL
jgi:glycosyltransferase involved in cell wall biosynthesis